MTLQEKIVVSAYTGYLMCDFDKVHEYIEQILQRPVFTHEMALPEVQKEIREKAHSDFIDICSSGKEQEQETKAPASWIISFDPMFGTTSLRCSACGYTYCVRGHIDPQHYAYPETCKRCNSKMLTIYH